MGRYLSARGAHGDRHARTGTRRRQKRWAERQEDRRREERSQETTCSVLPNLATSEELTSHESPFSRSTFAKG